MSESLRYRVGNREYVVRAWEEDPLSDMYGWKSIIEIKDGQELANIGSFVVRKEADPAGLWRAGELFELVTYPKERQTVAEIAASMMGLPGEWWEDYRKSVIPVFDKALEVCGMSAYIPNGEKSHGKVKEQEDEARR